ncbi:DUF346 domain-containing protein [Paractinoplanes rishiriensis]|uniref:PLL-like beta propeller domain-containing protein n=1 Tax=Paractinoplanes rishiriensis TaxID=1050105 RepID=A0A919JQL1_9ACTN|nr:DUF346 domain-containing protein [Actinoplanes rishiriensis]GIE93301.1 hypothetical protein Ari01nite_07660 [Actinoplanes rishiriensis]
MRPIRAGWLTLLTVTAVATTVLVAPAAHAAVVPNCTTAAPTAADEAFAARMNQVLTEKLAGAFNGTRAACTRVIVNVVRQRNLPQRAAEIALTTAIVETGIRNLDYGDRDSLGLFQQRPSQGWGTPAQLLDPVYATNAFLDAMLRKYPNNSWMSGAIGPICQTVQVSAFPERYTEEAPDGVRIAAAMWGAPESGVGGVVYDNLLRVFGRGTDGALWQYYWTGTEWKTQDLGGGIVGAPTAVVHGDVLRVFARGTDGALWQNYLVDGHWTWQRIGGVITSAPSAVVYDSMLRIFVRANDGALWQAYWTNNQWNWQDLGGGISSAPSAVVHGAVLRVFARGNDGALWQNFLTGGTWTWQDLGGGISSGPSAVMHGTVLRVFARGNDGALWQNYWAGNTWTWQDLGGGISGAPSAVLHGTVLRVFARGNDGALWQDFYNAGAWTWQRIGGAIT